MQGDKSVAALNSIESPNKKNINLPLSTDNHYFTAGKSFKGSTPSVKNTKYVTPKFTVKDCENNSSSKKLGVVGKMNSSNSKNKNLNNNIESSSFSRTASMTNLNSKNINNNNLPFNVCLPMQSPKNNDNSKSANTNSYNVISKDDSIRLNSFNLSVGNSNNNNNTSGMGSASNNNINNIKNYVNSQSKNYFKEIVESFKEKTLIFKSNLDANSNNNNETQNNLINLQNNANNNINNYNNFNSANNFYNSDGKINSSINYIDGNNNNILLNSFSGKLNFEHNSENLNYLKYRRNKNNSINFKENNLMKSIVSSPTTNSKGKKSKSHSIHNFPVSPESSDSRLNFEYNFPLNQKKLNEKISKESKNKSIRVDLANEVIKEELSSPTNNTERNNTNPNRILVYSSFNKENRNDSKDNNPLLNSKMNNLTSKIFSCSQSNFNSKNNNINNVNLKSDENFNINSFQNNDQDIVNNNFSPRSVYSSRENENAYAKNNLIDINNDKIIYKNNSNNNFNQTAFNQNSKNLLYPKDSKNVNKYQNERNVTCFSNSTGFAFQRNNNYSELKILHFQNNLCYLMNVLNNRLLNNKVFALNNLISFSQDQIRTSKRYSVKMIYRILKKRLVFLKLKFFTTSKFLFFVLIN